MQLLGSDSERKNLELSQFQLTFDCYKFLYCVNEPQSHIKIFKELPQPGMLLHGHPGWVNWYKQRFGIATIICDLEQQADLYTKIILGTPK